MGKNTMSQNTLWYTSEATRFEEALPTGNGRLGIMDYGNGSFLINEESLWSGTSKLTTPLVQDKRNTLETVRELIFKDQIEEAEGLLTEQLLGSWKETYLPCAKIHLKVNAITSVCTKRSLDLMSGISSYETDKYKVNTFVSKHSQCAVIRIDAASDVTKEATKEVKTRVTFEIEPLLEQTCTYRLGDVILLDGYCPSKVPSYDESDQSVVYDPSSPCIRYALAAKQVVMNESTTLIYLTVKTNYMHYGKINSLTSMELGNLAAQCVHDASQIAYESVYEQHVTAMKELFEMTTLDLPENASSSLTTDQRRLAFRQDATDYALISLYFNYGRYLLHQSSSSDSLPANLQGIWNEQLRAPWCSNFTTNINLQMNYWHSQVAQLDEPFQAFSNLLKGLSTTDDDYVSKAFDSEGLMINHNLDGWFTRGPVKGSPSWAYWPMASIWLGVQLFEQLRFVNTYREKKDLLPVFVSIAKFANRWLIKDSNGVYNTCPSTSPENLYLLENDYNASISYSSTMDIMMLHEFSHAFSKLTVELNEEVELGKTLAFKVDHMPDIQIHQDGYLKEWQHSYREKDIGHRHLSHLFGFFPGSYCFEQEPHFIEAGRQALFRRILDGGDFTSWHCTWVICLLARFEEVEYAKQYLNIMIGELTCPNLFSSHRRKMDGEELFQIDGNFGGARAISELIVQDFNETIKLIPVMGEIAPNGQAIGFRIRNGHTMDLVWEKHQLIKATIHGACSEIIDFSINGENRSIQVLENTDVELI